MARGKPLSLSSPVTQRHATRRISGVKHASVPIPSDEHGIYALRAFPLLPSAVSPVIVISYHRHGLSTMTPYTLVLRMIGLSRLAPVETR